MDASMREPSPRSYLFVPGNRPDRFDKAVSSTADVVICDVEDAVPPDEKAQSRDNVLEWLKKGASICVRVNGWNTPWFMDDVLAFASHPGVSAIMLPKAETANQISELQAHCHPSMKILPIIETARGFDALGAISSAMGVARIVFGTVDFQLDLGIDGDDLELLMFRSQIVLASRLAGIESPVDGVTTRIGDPDLVEANARRGNGLDSAQCFAFIRTRSPPFIVVMHIPIKRRHGLCESLPRRRQALAPQWLLMERWLTCL